MIENTHFHCPTPLPSSPLPLPQLVGGSASECDTIPGRQCMASCYFLLKQFDDVLIYLNSIKSYFYNEDSFNFNFMQAKAATGNFKEAEEVGSIKYFQVLEATCGPIRSSCRMENVSDCTLQIKYKV